MFVCLWNNQTKPNQAQPEQIKKHSSFNQVSSVTLLFVCPNLKALLGKQSINAQQSASYWPCLLWYSFSYCLLIVFHMKVMEKYNIYFPVDWLIWLLNIISTQRFKTTVTGTNLRWEPVLNPKIHLFCLIRQDSRLTFLPITVALSVAATPCEFWIYIFWKLTLFYLS